MEDQDCLVFHTEDEEKPIGVKGPQVPIIPMTTSLNSGAFGTNRSSNNRNTTVTESRPCGHSGPGPHPSWTLAAVSKPCRAGLTNRPERNLVEAAVPLWDQA